MGSREWIFMKISEKFTHILIRLCTNFQKIYLGCFFLKAHQTPKFCLFWAKLAKIGKVANFGRLSFGEENILEQKQASLVCKKTWILGKYMHGIVISIRPKWPMSACQLAVAVWHPALHKHKCSWICQYAGSLVHIKWSTNLKFCKVSTNHRQGIPPQQPVPLGPGTLQVGNPQISNRLTGPSRVGGGPSQLVFCNSVCLSK